MKRWLTQGGLLLAQLTTVVRAMELTIDQNTQQICSGMYSRKAWGGNVDPFILTKFITDGNAVEGDPIVSLTVFEWKDRPLTGRLGPDRSTKTYICDERSVQEGLCPESKLGAFVLAENATENANSQIVSEAIHLNSTVPVNYPIKHTGYYCVSSFPYSNEDYQAVIEFRNAFGELPAAQIAKLPFYAAITLVYAFLAIGWGALYYLNRRDILPVQNYITAILIFLVIEMFMTWLFYDYQNRHGLTAGAKALLIVVSVLSAARNSFSFFLLLIVCMGYGVVKPTLGKTMVYVRWLAVTHFVFGVIYAVASLAVTPENAGPLLLLVVLPLAATLTGFYVWTLNSLNATLKGLVERKQTIKAAMYRKLWYCILVSILVIFAFFFVNSWIFAGQSDEDFVPNNWSNRWFILDGWLNLVYFFDVAFIAYLWRPTANNRRFAMSEEIAQDDDGFEIASLRDSLDDLDADLEADANGHKTDAAYDPSRGPINRQASPLPAPVPHKPSPLPREQLARDSIEGETIFAVGEEDHFSEESGDEGDEERERLTGGKGD